MFDNGIQVDKVEIFDENGDLYIRSEYKEGKKNGMECIYHSDGSLESTVMYKNNVK